VKYDEDDEQTLSTRMARTWAARDRNAFYVLAVTEAFPRFCRMVAGGLNIPESDAEDCVAEALEAFLERTESDAVTNPYAYLSRSAWNNGTTLHRRRQRESVLAIEEFSPPTDAHLSDAETTEYWDEGATPVPDQWAVVTVEETLGDVEADASWAVIVVEEAVKQLTDAQRRLVLYLSNQPFDITRSDFDVLSREAAEALSMTPVAFRKAKQRAYEALREAIPQVVADLGLRPPARFAPAFPETRGLFMAEDPDEEG
jgi:DNA-directed RNA polymerase specialized sigma24 family protein